MSQNIPFIVTDNSITLVVGGKPYTINQSNTAFAEIKRRLINKDFDGIEQLFDTQTAVKVFTKGNVIIQNNEVLYRGKPIHGHIVERILQFMREGLPYQPLISFLENLMQNPSFRAVQELYTFLEKSNLPITDDGHFLAYRKVTEDFKDFYTRTFDNSIGKTVSMPRNLVDEEKSRTCSAGLHFCSQSYLSQYHGGQGKVVMVKINPANVVAIPEDYNNAKGRCCEYVVVRECPSHDAGETFGALYHESASVAFDDAKASDYDTQNEENREASREAGSEAGREDAQQGLVRNADEAFLEVNDGTINEYEFNLGYNEAYSEVYNAAQVAVAAPKKKVAKSTISEATRAKLRKAALRQKRDASGKYV